MIPIAALYTTITRAVLLTCMAVSYTGAITPSTRQIQLAHELDDNQDIAHDMQLLVADFVPQAMPILHEAMQAATELHKQAHMDIYASDMLRASLQELYSSMLAFRRLQLACLQRHLPADRYPAVARATEQEIAMMHGQMLEQEIDELIDQLEEYPEVIQAVNTYAQPFIQILQVIVEVVGLVAHKEPERLAQAINLYAELTPGLDVQAALEKKDAPTLAFVRHCTQVLNDYMPLATSDCTLLRQAVGSICQQLEL